MPLSIQMLWRLPLFLSLVISMMRVRPTSERSGLRVR
jgi:hypothetical protein